jgi:hypothetical protein
VGVTGRGRAAADAGRQQCSLLSWSMHSLITIQTVSYHVVRVHECNCQHTTHHALVSRAARSRETGGAGWLEEEGGRVHVQAQGLGRSACLHDSRHTCIDYIRNLYESISNPGLQALSTGLPAAALVGLCGIHLRRWPQVLVQHAGGSAKPKSRLLISKAAPFLCSMPWPE